MARRLNSLFERPGATAHVAYLCLFAFLCVTPLLLMYSAPEAILSTRPPGWVAFAFLVMMVCGFGFVYGPVRYRVRRLLNQCNKQAVLCSPCLILTGVVEQPGVAEIVAGRLILVPLFGRQLEIPLEHIESITLSHWFHGSDFESLTGFMVECHERKGRQLGFAVPDGDSWRAVLPHVTLS